MRLRHARLWRAPFDTTGMLGEPEPLGTEPAMYASVARDGAILFISESGLRVRSPNGQQRSLGWPLSYTPPVAEPTIVRNVRIIDGRGAPAGPAQDILIERGSITRMAAPGAQDTAGRRAMAPGAPPSRWYDNPPASDGAKVVISEPELHRLRARESRHGVSRAAA
jgi:hypothetical protein